MTLRALLDSRHAEGRPLSVDEIVAIVVPLCLDLKERHDRGERFYVHPSAIAPSADGLARIDPKLAILPTNARDRHCIAPELLQRNGVGDARASVFSIGAVLYEALTGDHVGPAMRRPRDVDPRIPENMEMLIAKALVGDPAHRPDDLGALASAMYHVAPAKSIHPPDVDSVKLDESAEFEVDVNLSLVPPPNAVIPRAAPAPRFAAGSSDPFGNVVSAPASRQQARPKDDPTARLGALKAQLESDVRPRYVVNRDRMDHGPFSAVELLQQIASGAFREDDILRDELSGQASEIKTWEEFAPFAAQAKLRSDIVAEKREVAAAVKAEKTAGVAKSIVGALAILVAIAAITLWIVKVRGSRSDDVNVLDDPTAAGLDVNGAIKGQKRAPKPGRGGGGGGGGFAGGMSYEAAIASNNQELKIGEKAGGPDLTDSQLAGPMRNAAFVDGCGASQSMKVTVRVAIKMGRAVGVSVSTNPPNPGVASCVDRAVRNIAWPVNPKMDSFTTTY
jgi:eukaryotic-like serine/threonine-protein kinase